MPRLRTHCAGMTGAPTIDIAVDGSWCLRQLVVHHMASVLSGFNWSQFDLVQFATSLMQSEIYTESASTAAGHEPYTWVSSAYRCDSPWLSMKVRVIWQSLRVRVSSHTEIHVSIRRACRLMKLINKVTAGQKLISTLCDGKITTCSAKKQWRMLGPKSTTVSSPEAIAWSALSYIADPGSPEKTEVKMVCICTRVCVHVQVSRNKDLHRVSKEMSAT